MKSLLLIPWLVPALMSAPLPAPSNLRAEYAETSLEITWDTVPGARGYNLYDRHSRSRKEKRRKINAALITSGPRFSYVWELQDGERVRRIKGYEHHIFVTAIFGIGRDMREGPFSEEIDNCYFEGYRNVLSRADLERTFVPRQAAAALPVEEKANSREDFIRFMEGPGRVLAEELKKSVDPLEVGACAPVSTVVVKLLDAWGLPAFRVEGTFIREFHTFVVINIEGVEYVLDFTADQFVPGVSPVFLPRDCAHLNARGRLSVAGTPVYQVNKVFSADLTDLADNKEGEVYRRIYDRVVSMKNR